MTARVVTDLIGSGESYRASAMFLESGDRCQFNPERLVSPSTPG